MSATGLEVFDTTLQKTNSWLKEIAQDLNTDRHGAYQALRAGLHCLRDRMTVEQAVDLGDQLPMLVRGIYYEAWHTARAPLKIRSRDEFLALLSSQLASSPIEPETAARAVFQALERHVTPGEISDVIQELPHDIRALWPQRQSAS